jgi:hypothetical protein
VFGVLCGMLQNSSFNVAYMWHQGICAERSDLIQPSPAARLLHALLLFPFRNCTVAHDLFYGMLGLLNLDTLPRGLLPNYRLSFDKISWDYASYILQGTKDLRLLGGLYRELNDCPTWVPDMRYRTLLLNKHDTTPMTNGAVSLSPDGRELHVEGSEVGKVLKCSCQDCPEEWGEGNLSYVRDVLLVRAAEINSQTPDIPFLKWIHTYYSAKEQHTLAFGEPCDSMDNLIATFRAQCSCIAAEELDNQGLSLSELMDMLNRSSCRNPDILRSIFVLAYARWCLLDTGDIIMCQQLRDDGVHHMPGDTVWALKNSYSLTLLHPLDHCWEYKGLMHQWELPAKPGTFRDPARYDDSVVLDEEYFASRKVQNLILV